jgi:hypothetical protein
VRGLLLAVPLVLVFALGVTSGLVVHLRPSPVDRAADRAGPLLLPAEEAAPAATTTTTAMTTPPTTQGPAAQPPPTRPRQTAAPRPTRSARVTWSPAERGAAALALIAYPWPRTGFSIEFSGPRDSHYGLTNVPARKISIFVRLEQTTSELARVIAHEIGHAVDVAFTDESERATYRRLRGLGNVYWYPACPGCADYNTPVGDFAEVFAYWLLGPGTFRSTAAPPPNAAQLKELASVFAPSARPLATATTQPRGPVLIWVGPIGR